MVRQNGGMRVAFDDQIFRAQSRGGVSRYIVELLTRLPRHGVTPVLAVERSSNRHLVEAGLARAEESPLALAQLEWFSWRVFGRPRGTAVERSAADLMHHTFTHPAYLTEWTGPRVVTVHDMTPELLPRHFPLGNPHFAKQQYAERSDAIISVSESTASDMLLLYGDHLRARTTTVPLGVSPRFFERQPASLDLPDRYLLFVGVRSGYKRFDLAVSAAVPLLASDPELRLVVVGGGPFTRTERHALGRAGVTGRVRRIVPTDAEMPEVYRRAMVLLFPSEYEGFGLPTLEALASGTPVVLADASSAREVSGELARFFPSGDREAAEAAVRAAVEPSWREHLALAGPKFAAPFTWDRVAAATAAVYRSVLGSR